MKRRFINECNPGDLIDDVFALSEKTLSQKKDGNNFLNVVLSDKKSRWPPVSNQVILYV